MRNRILLIVIVLLGSCAPRQKLLTGSWKFKDITNESVTDSASMVFINAATEQMRANLNITMEADSTYTIMQLKEKTATRGKWWLSADKKSLFTQTDLGLTKYRILKLTKTQLVYETKDPVSGQLMKMTCVNLTAGSK
jgi:hypothetical protein